MKIKDVINSDFHAINDILMKWNPLGVEGPALRDEYIGYIPKIIRLRKEPHELKAFLKKDLLNSLGVTYNSESESETAICELVEKILEIKAV
jgi:hypothetical protein